MKMTFRKYVPWNYDVLVIFALKVEVQAKQMIATSQQNSAKRQ